MTNPGWSHIAAEHGPLTDAAARTFSRPGDALLCVRRAETHIAPELFLDARTVGRTPAVRGVMEL